MGETVSLSAGDSHEFAAYRARPEGEARGGLVVIQEIFGVNGHMRDVVDGFDAIAPALFDRKQRDVELDYDEDGVAAGRALRMCVGWDGPMADIAAAIDAVSEAGKVGIIGYCWGGSLVWLAAARLNLACAVAFYGGQICQFRGEAPHCPIELHFGENDAGIPVEQRDLIAEWQPHVPIHLYPAGHGFTCDHRADFHPESAALGRQRSLALFAEHIG